MGVTLSVHIKHDVQCGRGFLQNDKQAFISLLEFMEEIHEKTTDNKDFEWTNFYEDEGIWKNEFELLPEQLKFVIDNIDNIKSEFFNSFGFNCTQEEVKEAFINFQETGDKSSNGVYYFSWG